jgi:hypothetical protein
MPNFNVKRDYDHGLWIADHPHPIVEIDAPDAKTAAEMVCGTELRENGQAGSYRAQVWPLGGVRYAHQIAHFYSA